VAAYSLFATPYSPLPWRHSHQTSHLFNGT